MTDKKPKKPQKLRARLPRGLVDRTPAEIAATRVMVEKIREVYERYGFEPVETPAMEYTDALGKFLPDQDRPNEGVFSFQDDDEQWISLRYDLTAPLARYVAENFETLPKPYRSYRNGYVYRNEKPGPGRFRQFMQFDADIVGGAPSGMSAAAADAEMCMMAADTMEALGIPRGSYVVKVNNRKVLDGVMESIGLGGDENAGRRLTVLRAIDKLDKFPVEEVRKLLGEGRKDESGDFTKGAGLNSAQADKVLVLFEIASMSAAARSSNVEFQQGVVSGEITVRKAEDIRAQGIFGGIAHNLLGSSVEGLAELQDIWKLLRAGGYDDGRVRIDPSVVRGLEYYTGPVYEVELLLETKDEMGRPVRFGSVGGGGRYDGLVSRFRGEPVPATGFSIGVSRLQAALTMLGKIDTTPEFGPVVVLVMDRNEIAQYQKFVATLRNSPVDPSRPDGPRIRAELYLGNPKNNLGVQFKYADRRNSPCVVIQGGDEKAKGEVQIKDMIAGSALADASGSVREEHLQAQAKAQVAVKESELVEAVRKVLRRHQVNWR